MKITALMFGLVFSLATVGIGQTRTITNATLDKFAQKRLAAERDYRDNYERMGFPSPEELERQREEDMRARLELADQLRTARLEEQRIELERRSLDIEAARLDAEIEASRAVEESIGIGGFYSSGFFSGGFGGFGRGRFGFHRDRFFPRVGGYRATPFGIIPTPPPPRPQRVLRGTGRHGGHTIRGRR